MTQNAFQGFPTFFTSWHREKIILVENIEVKQMRLLKPGGDHSGLLGMPTTSGCPES